MPAHNALLAIVVSACLAGSHLTPASSNVIDNGQGETPRQMATSDFYIIFGISISKESSEQTDPVRLPNGMLCHYCEEAEQGIEYWRTKVNSKEVFTEDGDRMFIRVLKLYDGGDPQKVEENYEQLATYNNQGNENPMLALFGPCWSGFNHIAARVAAKHNIVLILWSFEYWSYFITPGADLSPEPRAALELANASLRELMQVKGRLEQAPPARRQLQGTGAWPWVPRDFSELLAVDTEHDLQNALLEDWTQPGVPSALPERQLASDTVEGSDLDDPIWDQNYTNIIDINVPESKWAFDAIKKVRDHGAKRMVFIHGVTPMGRLRTNSVDPKRQCLHLLEYAQSLTGVQASEFETGREGRTLMEDMSILRAQQDDALIVCGDIWLAVLLTLTAKAFEFNVKAMVFTKPMGTLLVNMIQGFSANYFIEGFPMTLNPTVKDFLYDNFNELKADIQMFWDNKKSDLSSQSVGFASLQTAVAGSLLIGSMRNLSKDMRNLAKNSPTNDITVMNAIMDHFRNSTMQTFWGDLRFDTSGKRIAIGSTRQFVPYTENQGTNLERRFIMSQIKVVDAVLAAQCSSRNTCLFTDLRYPSPGWLEKELQVYPCAPGCFYNTQRCDGCPRGKFRTPSDLACRNCPSGKYAHVKGLSECYSCLTGGNCANPEVQPLPQANFFPMGVAGNASEEDDQQWADMGTPLCVNPYRVLNMVKNFEACYNENTCTGRNGVSVSGYHTLTMAEATSTCRGSNTGLLCGQCRTGYTTQIFQAGKRLCYECKTETLIVYVVVVILFYCTCWTSLSHSAFLASHKVHCIICAMLRSIVHHFQMAAIILEATRIDANDNFSALCVPFGIFLRPLEMMQVACLRDHNTTETSLKDLIALSGLVLPLGAATVVALHLLMVLLRIAGFGGSLASRPLTKAIGAVCQCIGRVMASVAASESDDDAEDEREKDQPKQIGYNEKLPPKKEEPVKPEEKHGLAGVKERSQRSIAAARKKVGRIPGAYKKEEIPVPEEKMDPPGTQAVFDETAAPQANPKTQAITGADSEWSMAYGPGKVFLAMHEGFVFSEHLRTITREIIIVLLLLYPVVLRITFMATNCVGVKRGSAMEVRMVADYDIVCDSPAHEDVIGSALTVQVCYGIGLPVVLLLYSLFKGPQTVFSVKSRRIAAVLFTGYKTDFFFWEIVILGQLASLIVVARAHKFAYRCFLLCVVLIFFMLLTFYFNPYEDKDRRVLHWFNMCAHVAMLYTLWIGYFSNDMDAEEYIIKPGESSGMESKTIGIASAVLFNYLIFFYGIIAIVYNNVSLKLQAIIDHSETDVDRMSRLFHVFVKNFYRGMNNMSYVQMKRGNGSVHALDVSKLDEPERNFLVQCLTSVVSACFDSGNIFNTWLLENAITSAFERAFEARAARLRALYEKNGTRNFSLLRFGPLRLFGVTLRPPDIHTDITKVNETGWAGSPLAPPDKFKFAVDGKLLGDPGRHGITVEEFYTALSQVNDDILERHPRLHAPPSTVGMTGQLQEEKHQPLPSLTTWVEGASFTGFQNELKLGGSIEFKEKEKADPHKGPDQELWKLFTDETEVTRERQKEIFLERNRQAAGFEKRLEMLGKEFEEGNPAEKESELKDDLQAMEDEIKALKQQLKDVVIEAKNDKFGPGPFGCNLTNFPPPLRTSGRDGDPEEQEVRDSFIVRSMQSTAVQGLPPTLSSTHGVGHGSQIELEEAADRCME